MQCRNTSLMNISEDLFSECLVLVLASELKISLFPHSYFILHNIGRLSLSDLKLFGYGSTT